MSSTQMDSSKDEDTMNEDEPLVSPDTDLTTERRRIPTEQFDIEEGSNPDVLPRFLQPPRSRSLPHRILAWTQAPIPARPQTIKPIFPSIQALPINLLNAVCPDPKAKLLLLILLTLTYLIPFTYLLHTSIAPSTLNGHEIIPLGCTDTFWYSGNGCGLDGIDCRPFNKTSFPFRCSGNCASVKVLNPRPVGAKEVVYRPYVIGGGEPWHDIEGLYRGDSWICGAAVHAGVVRNVDGGCGVVRLNGEGKGYVVASKNGIESIGFESTFPLSFVFEEADCKARDLRWWLLLLTLGFTVTLSMFTTSSGVFFAMTFTVMFFHVGLVSDPPFGGKLNELFSDILGKFLPAAFCGLAFYLFFLRLEGLKAQIEKTIFWLGGCWIGALANYTFDWIPIQRLTPHDLKQQPGAKAALAFIVLVLCGIVAQQIHYFRLEGRLLRFLGVYAIFCLSLISLLLIPTMRLRIHHYVLALLLIPGTSMQTRPSLLYQGLLLGLFINGIARWGFDSILQTDRALRQDGHFNSILPNITEPTISLDTTPSTISFNWTFPPAEQEIMNDIRGEVDGISILVNDVERYRKHVDEVGDGEEEMRFLWEREEGGRDESTYFRFGYLQGKQSFDYTKAGIWDERGRWVEMEPGPGVRSRDGEGRRVVF